MALTRAVLAQALRVVDSSDDGDGPILDRLASVVEAITAQYAPDAPAGVADEAGIRLAGWLYDRPAEQPTDSALVQSGASGLLDPFRTRSVAVLDPEGGATPTPTPTPSGIPTPPESGHYVLSSNDGELEWLEFPAPR